MPKLHHLKKGPGPQVATHWAGVPWKSQYFAVNLYKLSHLDTDIDLSEIFDIGVERKQSLENLGLWMWCLSDTFISNSLFHST